MDDMYSPERIVSELRGFGFELFIGEDGVVHGKPRERGQVITLQMRAVIDRLRMANDAVAQLLRSEPERLVLDGISVDDAVAWSEKIKAGEYRLIGDVVYHKSTGLTDMVVEKVVS